MKTENNSQLELFGDIKGALGQAPQKRGSFFGRMQGYEKKVLLVICFIVVAIAAFSLGVEKGKKITPEVNLVAAKTQVVLPEAPEKQAPALMRKEDSVNPKEAKSPLERYTIQVASYKTARYAQQEAEEFRKKGLTPLIITKGVYTVLYVGNFPDQEAAKSALSELKRQKRYAGSMVRRL